MAESGLYLFFEMSEVGIQNQKFIHPTENVAAFHSNNIFPFLIDVDSDANIFEFSDCVNKKARKKTRALDTCSNLSRKLFSILMFCHHFSAPADKQKLFTFHFNENKVSPPRE